MVIGGVTGLLFLVVLLGIGCGAVYRWSYPPAGIKFCFYGICLLTIFFATVRTFNIALP